MPKIPEIRIQHGWLLQNAFVSYMEKIPEYAEKKAPTKERALEMVKERRESWKKEESKILTAMTEITGLKFYKNIIDVYLVFGYGRAFSSPLTVSFRYQSDDFIDVLTHELLHGLLTDNTIGFDGSDWPTKKYPEIEDKKATNHILVHAVHKEIYLQCRTPERLALDIEKCQKFPSYKLAWDIVERDGHMNIISDFKKSYAK